MSEFAFTRPAEQRSARLYELFHEASKLNMLSGGHSLTPEKIYITTRSARSGVASGSIPLTSAADGSPLDGVIANRRSARDLSGSMSLEDVSGLIRACAVVTGALEENGGPIFALRASPSGGALYPIDLYLVALSVENLGRAVYYFHPFAERLQKVHGADPGRIADEGFFSQNMIREATALFLMVANFRRTVWKYGERGYRLCLLDAGHMAENILLKATELGCASTPVAGFHDDLIARVLGIDATTEAVVHSVAIGGRGTSGIRNAR